MNFSLEDFGANLKPIDFALYAGVLVVLYVLFQDKINSFLNNIKSKLETNKSIVNFPTHEEHVIEKDDVFFALIQSWKTTRDLAEEYGATKAVEIADQMFPHLVPKEEVRTNEE